MIKRSSLIRLYIFFKHGHSGWLAFIISLLNFATIQHSLLISRIPFLAEPFSNFFTFTIVFVIIYLPAAILVGWIDYKRGTIPSQTVLTAKVSPYVQATLKAFILHYQGKDEEAIEMLKPYLSQKDLEQ